MSEVFSIWGGGFGLPETVALGAVAVIGYIFGCRGRGADGDDRPTELIRAAEIARQLEGVASTLRSDLAAHRSDVERFKRIVRETGEQPGEESWRALHQEADRVLEPTLRLVSRVADAYDKIRRQTQALSDFSGGRTDSLTGLSNSRALSELLRIELSGHAATGGQFSIAILSLHTSGTESRPDQNARILQASELLRAQLRESDRLARYGIDELVVVMPHTRLYGGSVFGHRVRSILSDAGLIASCGLAQSAPEDTSTTLLGRADSALYSAKASQSGSQFLHNGHAIRRDKAPRESEQPTAEIQVAPADDDVSERVAEPMVIAPDTAAPALAAN